MWQAPNRDGNSNRNGEKKQLCLNRKNSDFFKRFLKQKHFYWTHIIFLYRAIRSASAEPNNIGCVLWSVFVWEKWPVLFYHTRDLTTFIETMIVWAEKRMTTIKRPAHKTRFHEIYKWAAAHGTYSLTKQVNKLIYDKRRKKIAYIIIVVIFILSTTGHRMHTMQKANS